MKKKVKIEKTLKMPKNESLIGVSLGTTLNQYINVNAEKMNYQDNASTFHSGAKSNPEAHKISEASDFKVIDQNEFEILKEIGQGIKTRVFLAIHKPSKKNVAIKFIECYDHNTINNYLKSIREFLTAKSGHIINFYGTFRGTIEGKGGLGLVLEFMNLGNIKNLIRIVLEKKIQIPETIIANIILKVLKGLAFLNIRQKTIHNNLKPENILLNSNGDTKIADIEHFSIPEEELYDDKKINPSYYYISPEKITGEGKDFCSSIWNVGLLIIEIITGKNAYPPRSEIGIKAFIELMVEGPPPSLPTGIGLSADLIEFVSLCLDKNYKTRKPAMELISHKWCKSAAKDEEYLKWLELIKKEIQISHL